MHSDEGIRFKKQMKEKCSTSDEFLNRGNAKYDLGEYEEAIKDYDKAIGIDSNCVAAYNNRGSAKLSRSRSGKFRDEQLGSFLTRVEAGLKEEEAVKDYDKAIGIDSNDVDAYNNRGNAKSKSRKYEEAIEDAKNKAIEKKTKEFEDVKKSVMKQADELQGIEQETLSRKYFALANEKTDRIVKLNALLVVYLIIFIGWILFLYSWKNNLFQEANITVSLIMRIPLISPIIYLMWLTVSNLRREIFIRDQYNFKGSLMRTYRNISTHIKNLEFPINEEKQLDLLEKTFNAILENEADKLEIADKNFIKNIELMRVGLTNY